MIVRELLARLGIEVEESGFEKAHSAIEKVRNGLLKMAAVGTGVAVALREITKEAADHSREILRTAKITGMSAEALQGLDYAAKMSGVSAEELHQGLVRLARSALETSKGSGTAGYAYQRLGVHVSSAAGKLRPLNDIFGDVARALQKMPDGTEKAALSMELFGRAGAQLIPLLDQGPEGLARFTEEAKKLGLIMDEKTLAAGNRYRVTLERLSGAVEGLKHGIAERLLPAFTKSTEKLIAWIVAHREWIGLHVEKAFEAVSQVLHGLLAIATGVVSIFERIWKSGATGKTVLAGLAAAVALFTAPWMSLIAILALVAEDIEGYFEGKDSITGRIVYAFERMSKELGLGNWFDTPVANMMAVLGKFFTWVVDEAQALPERIARVMSPSSHASFGQQLSSYIKYTLGQVMIDTANTPGAANLGMWVRRSAEDDMDLAFAPRPAFVGVPGSQTGYSRIDGSYYPFDRGVSGAGPGISIPITVNVEGAVGPYQDALGQKIGDALRPVVEDTVGKMLREAYAASDKRNAP